MPDPMEDLQALAENLRGRQPYRRAWRAVLVLAHALSGAGCVTLVATDAPLAALEVALWVLVAVHVVTLVHLVADSRRA